MRKLIYIACVLVFAACSTSRKTPPPPVVVTNTDSVRTEYIEKVRLDTVTVTVEIPVEVVRQVVNDTTSHLETSVASSDAWINPDGTLGHSLSNKPQKIACDAVVPVTDVTNNSSSASVREIPVPYPVEVEVEREFTKWESVKMASFWYLIVFVAITLIWIFRNPIKTAFGKFW